MPKITAGMRVIYNPAPEPPAAGMVTHVASQMAFVLIDGYEYTRAIPLERLTPQELDAHSLSGEREITFKCDCADDECTRALTIFPNGIVEILDDESWMTVDLTPEHKIAFAYLLFRQAKEELAEIAAEAKRDAEIREAV